MFSAKRNLPSVNMTLELDLKPWRTSKYSLISELFVRSQPNRLCYILERPYTGRNTRDNPATKEINESEAIMPGRYEITLNWSNSFKQIMIIVLGVPGRDGIRIHIANRPSELLGCLGPGLIPGTDMVANSTEATKKVVEIILPVLLSGGKVFLNVERPKVF